MARARATAPQRINPLWCITRLTTRRLATHTHICIQREGEGERERGRGRGREREYTLHLLNMYNSQHSRLFEVGFVLNACYPCSLCLLMNSIRKLHKIRILKRCYFSGCICYLMSLLSPIFIFIVQHICTMYTMYLPYLIH